MRSFVTLLGPALLGATAYQITIFLSTLFASLLQEGSVSWLNYADRVTQLPMGVFSVALASVLLPALSRASGNGNRSEFLSHLSNSLRVTSFVLIPSAAWIGWFAGDIVTVVFERGAFDSVAAVNTTRAIQALSLGLWSASCHSMIARAFIANKDTKTPMRIGFTSLLLFTLLAVCLMGPPHAVGFAAEAVVTVQTFICKYMPLPFDLGHVGIALASSISSLLSFSVILGVLVVRSKDLMLTPFLLSTVKASVATVVSIGVTHFVSRSLSFDSGAISLALGGASAFTTWFITSLLLATAEAKEVLQILRRRVANLQRP